MTTTDPETPTGLTRHRFFWPVIALIGVSLGIAWTAWVAWSDVPPFQTQTFAFDIIDDQHMTVTFDVYRTEPVALECTVLAQDLRKNIVGEKIVEVPTPETTADREKLRIVVDLATDRRPTTGYVHECELI